MSKDQKLPLVLNEQPAAIEPYVDQSRELIPGLELTLAKRIMRPGTNRVVCLAARTSVPLNDDELASVSDVALKLSDGTNVRLSVSLFNDLAGTSFTPFKRYCYDPSRYATRNNPNFGTFILAMLLVSSAGFYSMSTESFRRAQWQALVNAYHSHSSATIPSFVPAKSSAKASEIKDKGKSCPPPSQKSRESVKGINPISANSHRRLSNRSDQGESKVSKAHISGQGTMLIPPPPPVPYSLPDRSLLFQYDPGQLIKPAPSPDKAVSPPKRPLDSASGTINRSLRASGVPKQDNGVCLPEDYTREVKLERIVPSSVTSGQTAPLPGSNASF